MGFSNACFNALAFSFFMLVVSVVNELIGGWCCK